MKIVAVCSFGVGSSVIAKMNIEKVLKAEGRDDIMVETADLGSVTGSDGDLFVTTNEIFENFPEELKDKTIVLNNFIDQAAIKEGIDPRL